MSTEASIRIILQDESGPSAGAIPTDTPGAPAVPSATAPPIHTPPASSAEQAGEADPSAVKQTTGQPQSDDNPAGTTQAIGSTAAHLEKAAGRVVTATSAAGQISSVLDLIKSLRKAIRDTPGPSAPETGREAPLEQLPPTEDAADEDDTVVDGASDPDTDARDAPTRDDYREVVTSLDELNRNLNAVIDGRNDSPGVTERITDRSSVLDRSERTDSSTELDRQTDRSSDRQNERTQEASSNRESNRVTETAKEKLTREKLQREGTDRQRDRFEDRLSEIDRIIDGGIATTDRRSTSRESTAEQTVNRIIDGGETTTQRTVESLTKAVSTAIENRHEVRETAKETTKQDRIKLGREGSETARQERDKKLDAFQPRTTVGRAAKRGVERFNAARDTFSDSTREVASRVSEKASVAREKISERTSAVRGNATEKLSDVRESITNTLRDAIQSVTDSKTGQRVQSATRTVHNSAREVVDLAKSTPTGQRIGQFAESAKAATSETAKRFGTRIAGSSAGQAVRRVGQRIAGSRVGQAVAGTAGRAAAGTFGRGAAAAGMSAATGTANTAATGTAAAAGAGIAATGTAAAGTGAAAGSAAGAAGTAVAGAAAATGPIGLTVAGVVVALGTLALAAKGLSDAFGAAASDLGEYSPELTQVSTGRETRDDEQRVDRADRLGPELAQLEAAKADLSEEMYELQTKLYEFLIREIGPPLKTTVEIGTAGVAGVNLLIESIETAVMSIDALAPEDEKLKQALELIQAQVKFHMATQGVLRDDDPFDSLRHDPDIQAFFAAGDAENARKPKGIRPNNMPDGW